MAYSVIKQWIIRRSRPIDPKRRMNRVRMIPAKMRIALQEGILAKIQKGPSIRKVFRKKNTP
jgi:hypothetical protein